MSLKEQLLEELQKLRLSRERPYSPKSTKSTKQSKTDKLLQEAMSLLAQVEKEEG